MKKMFVLVLCAVLSLALIVPSVQAGSNPKGKPFVAINDQIVEVSGAVTTLQDQIDLLVEQVDSIDQRLEANEAALLTLENQNSALETLIQTGLTSVDEILTEVDFLTQEIGNTRDDIASNAGDIVALETELNEKIALKMTLEDAIVLVNEKTIDLESSLQAQIANNFDLIEALQGEIAIVNEKLMAKQNMVNGYCPDGSAVQQIFTDGSVSCGEAGGMSGQLEMVRVYLSTYDAYKDVYPPDGYVPPGTVIKVNVFCEPGWTATGSGVNQFSGWEILKSSTEGPLANGLSWASIQARNNNNSLDWFTGVVNCVRIKP